MVTASTALLPLFGAGFALSACNVVLGDFPVDAELRCEDRHSALDPAAISQEPGALVFAMRNVQYAASTTSADAQPIGFDLDLGATCTPPPWAAPESDARPIDNAFAAAATRVGALGGVSLNGMYNEVMERGHGTTIFSIWGYNGEANDPEIELAVFEGSMGVTAREDHASPRWDGTDTWYVTPAYVSRDVCPAPLVRTRGTVTSWTVDTAVFPEAPDGKALRWRATLVKGKEGFSLRNGVMGSLWRIHDFFVLLGNSGPEYCTSAIGYPIFRQIYCESVDMDSDSDGVCDALSVGGVFEAHPVRIGGVREYSSSGCPPAENPATYGCDRQPPR